jgi:alpha-L-fucosidase
MLPELVDLVKRYEPAVIWADGDWEFESDYWQSVKFLSWLYNESPVKDYVVTNDRWGHECRGNKGGYWTPSDGYNPGKIIPHKWENCQTISTSWYVYKASIRDCIENSMVLLQCRHIQGNTCIVHST